MYLHLFFPMHIQNPILDPLPAGSDADALLPLQQATTRRWHLFQPQPQSALPDPEAGQALRESLGLPGSLSTHPDLNEHVD